METAFSSADIVERRYDTYFDLRWPSSTSPSTSTTLEMNTSCSSSLLIEIVVSSRWNQVLAHGVTFLFFQCQFAVDAGMLGGIAAMSSMSCRLERN